MSESNCDRCRQWLASGPSPKQLGEKLLLVEGYLEKTGPLHPKYADYRATHTILLAHISSLQKSDSQPAEKTSQNATHAPEHDQPGPDLSALGSDVPDVAEFQSVDEKLEAFKRLKLKLGELEVRTKRDIEA